MKPRSRLKRRKNFLPTFLLALLFWISWGFILFRIPPESNFLLFTFYFLLFFAVFLTSALIFADSRLGLITATFIIIALLFRYFQIGNFLNLLLLAGIFIALGLYCAKG